MARLLVRLLGPFSAELEGYHLSGFRSNKVRSLLAYLMVEWRRPWSRTTLAGLLWPDLPEASAQSNLRNALSNLRHVLGDTGSETSFFILSETTLQFNRGSDSWLDLWAFLDQDSQTGIRDISQPEKTNAHHLETVLALYRGELLEGFSVDSAPMEEWILATREQARQRQLQILRWLAQEQAQWGELEDASAHTGRYLEIEPWDESAYRYQMQLLSALNRRSAALALYAECKTRLAQDLDIEPEPETLRLYEQIRDGKPGTPLGSTLQTPGWEGIEALPQRRIPEFLIEGRYAKEGVPLFFARQRELGLLESALEEANSGHGQVLFVTGEPGSGKTALLSEFSRRVMLVHPALLVTWGQCNAFTGQGDPYYPFLNTLRMLAGEVEISVSSGVISTRHAQRLWKFLPDTLDALVEHGPDLFDRFLSAKDLLSMARLNTHVSLSSLRRLQAFVKGLSDPIHRSHLTQAVLYDQLTQVFCQLALRHPLIVVLDDLQWIDPGSVNLLFHLARQIAGSKILILGAYRPEEIMVQRSPAAHPLQGVIQELGALYGDIQIDLMQSEGSQFVKELIQSEPNELDQHFQDSLYQHTSGNPLFTIELLRGMQLRAEILKNNRGKWVHKRDLNWGELPGRVEAVIARRIAHLSEECQEMVNVACVEGEQFSAEVIAGVMERDIHRVCDLLSKEVSKQHQLVTAQSLQQVGAQNLSIYRFRHSLFQIYLYNHLDLVEKRKLHAKVGTVLEQNYAFDRGKLAEIAHVLARHFETAGLVEKTIQYYSMAGKYSLKLSASRAAIDHLQNALRYLQSLPESEARDWQALDLYLSLGPPITATRGWAAPELEKNYQHAEELCRKLSDDARLVPALWLLAVYRLGRAEHASVDKLVDRLHKLAQKIGNPDLLQLADLQVSPLYQGRLVEARKILVRASKPRGIEQQRSLALQFGMAPSVVASAYLGNCLWLLGFPDQAAKRSLEAIDLSAQVNLPMTACYAVSRNIWQHAFAGDVEAVSNQAKKMLQVARQHELRSFELAANFFMEWVKNQVGDSSVEVIDQMSGAMDEYKRLGTLLNRTTFLNLFAQACGKAGQIERSLVALDESITVGEKTGELWFKAETLRLKGEMYLLKSSSSSAEAEIYFRQALQVSSAQEAKTLELRAAICLARLWQSQGRMADAYCLLNEVYSWFTEGFDSPDLKEAYALLETLTGEGKLRK